MRTQHRQTETVSHQNGKVVFNKTMTVDPIFNGVKGMAELANPHRMKSGRKYLGSVDPFTAQAWARECGCSVGTKGFADYAIKKLKSSEYAHYRAASEKVNF